MPCAAALCNRSTAHPRLGSSVGEPLAVIPVSVPVTLSFLPTFPPRRHLSACLGVPSYLVLFHLSASLSTALHSSLAALHPTALRSAHCGLLPSSSSPSTLSSSGRDREATHLRLQSGSTIFLRLARLLLRSVSPRLVLFLRRSTFPFRPPPVRDRAAKLCC